MIQTIYHILTYCDVVSDFNKLYSPCYTHCCTICCSICCTLNDEKQGTTDRRLTTSPPTKKKQYRGFHAGSLRIYRIINLFFLFKRWNATVFGLPVFDVSSESLGQDGL